MLDNSMGELGVKMFVLILCFCSVVLRVCSPLLVDAHRLPVTYICFFGFRMF